MMFLSLMKGKIIVFTLSELVSGLVSFENGIKMVLKRKIYNFSGIDAHGLQNSCFNNFVPSNSKIHFEFLIASIV